jgi:GNAT superfamily N-acetyltransferase
VVLRDGSRALVRPVEPGDAARLRRGLRELSPHARYLRFHAAVDELSDEQVRYLTDVDGRDHIAWVALDPDDPDAPGMGVARCIRLADEPEVAEAAVTVLDRYQGRGVGTLLLDLVSRSAAREGITTLRSYVLADNAAMLRVLEEQGATKVDDGEGVFRLDLPLERDGRPGAAVRAALRASAGARLRFLRRSLAHRSEHAEQRSPRADHPG